MSVSTQKGLYFAKIFVPYLTTAYGQPEKSLISCGFTRLDLFTSTCFCLSWCVTASVISGANGFWLRSIRSHPAGHEKSAGAGISGKSEAEVPENILNGQDLLRGRTLPAAGLFQKKRRFLVRSGKITTFLCFCNKCLLINYPSSVLAIHTLFVYNKDVRGSSQCAAPDEEQNSIPNEKNLRGVCYHGFR